MKEADLNPMGGNEICGADCADVKICGFLVNSLSRAAVGGSILFENNIRYY